MLDKQKNRLMPAQTETSANLAGNCKPLAASPDGCYIEGVSYALHKCARRSQYETQMELLKPSQLLEWA